MSIRFNHTLVHAHDKKASSAFLTRILGLPPASPFGSFLVVELENKVSLDFLPVPSLVKVFTTKELEESMSDAGFKIDCQWQPGKNKAVFIVASKAG